MWVLSLPLVPACFRHPYIPQQPRNNNLCMFGDFVLNEASFLLAAIVYSACNGDVRFIWLVRV